MILPRRTVLGMLGGVAISAAAEWPPAEGAGVPKLCLGAPSNLDEKGMQRLRQIGINHVLMGGPRIPWTEANLRPIMDHFKAAGLTVCNMMIGGFPNCIYGKPGRDQEIEKIHQSIRAAAKVGLPVIEYNFYAHRLVEGYYEEKGRGNAGMTAYDYERSKNLPPLPEIGTHDLDSLWKNVTYFLKAIVPVAKENGIRLALHPNDPPVPLSRGSGQIMATLAGWKRLVDIVPDPANGITFDCGVTREMGEDPVTVCKYFGGKDRINHVHFRNVRVRKPSIDYTEVFPDEGQVDMFAVMRELVRQKYPRAIYPEHPRLLDADKDLGLKAFYPGGGGYVGEVYNVAYTKAMLQAALSAPRH